MTFTEIQLELMDNVSNDILHIGAEAHLECTDHQLRRISVQLRALLIEDQLIQCWKLLGFDPKQPRIAAPRLQTDGLNNNAMAFAQGGTSGLTTLLGFKYVDRALS
jgi:hypothetical protein